MARILRGVGIAAIIAAGGLVLSAPAAVAQTTASCTTGRSFFDADVQATGCSGVVDQGASYVIVVGHAVIQRPFNPGQWLSFTNVTFTCSSATITGGGTAISGAPCSSSVIVH